LVSYKVSDDIYALRTLLRTRYFFVRQATATKNFLQGIATTRGLHEYPGQHPLKKPGRMYIKQGMHLFTGFIVGAGRPERSGGRPEFPTTSRSPRRLARAPAHAPDPLLAPRVIEVTSPQTWGMSKVMGTKPPSCWPILKHTEHFHRFLPTSSPIHHACLVEFVHLSAKNFRSKLVGN
jgi:hypothetical protein